MPVPELAPCASTRAAYRRCLYISCCATCRSLRVAGVACFHGQLGQVYLCGGIPSGSRGVGDALKEVYSHGAWGLACSLQAYSLHPPQRARCVACSGVATYCSPASTVLTRCDARSYSWLVRSPGVVCVFVSDRVCFVCCAVALWLLAVVVGVWQARTATCGWTP